MKRPDNKRFSTHAPCPTGVSHRVYCPECQNNSNTYRGGANMPQTAPYVTIGGRLPRSLKFTCGHVGVPTGSIYR